MRGVDRADQIVQCYPLCKTVLNSSILFKKYTTEKNKKASLLYRINTPDFYEYTTNVRFFPSITKKKKINCL